MSWEHFIEMGGYGTFIWTAYGITGVVLLVNLCKPWLQRKRLLRHLSKAQADNE